MKVVIHQTHQSVADFKGIYSYLSSIELNSSELHVFPELFLTGYPLADLCLNKSFIKSYQELLEQIKTWSPNIPKDCHLLMGGLHYEFCQNNRPERIENVIYHVNSSLLQPVYSKQLLPNYDIFDEKKYFAAGEQNKILNVLGKDIALLICEDMWPSNLHKKDPVLELAEENFDLILNLSASPFHIGKAQKRVNRAKEISNHYKKPFIYVNRVGGEDEILFDGQSFIQAGDKTLLQAPNFKADTIEFELTEYEYAEKEELSKENVWESLYCSRLAEGKNLSIEALNESECAEAYEALKFGFKEYARKSGFKNFSVALSGGIDSALVLAIARLALEPGQYLEAIYMPSVFSSSLSYELCAELSKNLGVPLYNLPIKFLHSTAKNVFGQTFNEPFEGLTDENIQARIRGTLLYTRSNQINSMVINTSNKSELAVGYSTQYGDSVGAISLLGDLYKSQVYALVNYINKIEGQIIPKALIERLPTAELKEGQTDNQSLPEYEVLDTILESLLSNEYTQEDLLKLKMNPQEVQKVFDLYKKSEYKRKQFCPIIKLSSKSFGFGYRVPISKDLKFYDYKGDIK